MSFVSAKTKHAQSRKSNASILTAHKKRSCFRLFGRHCYFRKCFHTKTKPRNKFNESQAAGIYNPKTPQPHERSSKHASRPVSWPDLWRAATEFTAMQILKDTKGYFGRIPLLNWVTSAEGAIVCPTTWTIRIIRHCRVNHDFGGQHATCLQDDGLLKEDCGGSTSFEKLPSFASEVS